MRAPHYLTLSVAILAVIGLCAAAPDTTPGVDNPHGRADACLSCHVAAADGSAGPALPVVETCRSCHPTADMHRVDVHPRQAHVPAGFPLEGGRVTCATCHAEPAHGGEVAALPKPWHRGGPYARVSELCNQCHDESAYPRVNPHLLDEDGGNCAACHVRLPTAHAAPETAALRGPPAESCTVCHPSVSHAGLGDHLGKTAPPDTTLPTAGGTIACFTCHDVHQQTVSVLPPPRGLASAVRERLRGEGGAALPADVVWPGESHDNTLLAAPLAADALCRDCHRDLP